MFVLEADSSLMFAAFVLKFCSWYFGHFIPLSYDNFDRVIFVEHLYG